MISLIPVTLFLLAAFEAVLSSPLVTRPASLVPRADSLVQRARAPATKLVGRARKSAYLNAHNDVRAQHGADALTWSDDLANAAQEWANQCTFSQSGTFGENVAAATGNFTPAEAVQAWMNEAGSYNPSNPTPSHFAQVVWKGTTQFGCAVKSCTSGPGLSEAVVQKYGPARYYVCRYSEPGNVIGGFAANVQA